MSMFSREPGATRRVRRRTRGRYALAAAITAALMATQSTRADEPDQPAPAAAAEAPKPADQNGMENITVTAQFRKQDLQETPLAITAVNAAMLEARSQTSLADVAAEAPNVILQPNTAGFGDSMRAEIRGVGQTDFDPAVDPGVGIYIDDVYFPTLTGSDFALLDLDRVEILRGPQGTLSGMDSLGGSVKLYSQKATGDNSGYLEATAGDFDRIDVKGSGDWTLIPDQLFIRISGISRKQDGYVQLLDYACANPTDPYVLSGAIPRGNSGSDCRTGTEGGLDYTAVRASIRWLPSDKLEINWITDATDQDNGTDPVTLLQTFSGPGSLASSATSWFGAPYDNRFVPKNPYVSYANFLDPGVTYTPINTAGAPGAPNGAFYADPDNTLSSWGTSLTADWQLADKLSLKSITAFRHYLSGFGDDNSASPIPLVLEEGQFENRQYSEELRLNGSVEDFLDYTVGGIYFNQLTYYRAREDDPFLAGIYGTLTEPTFDFLQDDPTRTKTEAGFVSGTWHITHQASLNGGVRYTSEDKGYTFERLNIDGVTPYLPLSSPTNPLNGTTGVYDGSHVDYRVDFDYQWDKDLMTYVEWSTGFKGGGITPRPYFPEQVIPFGPEVLKSWEAGVKSEWLDNRVRANLAVFYEDYYGVQGSVPAGFCVNAEGQPLPPQYANPCGEYINVANGDGKGAELELEARPVDGLLINAAYSYLDFTYTQTLAAASIPIGSAPPGVGKTRGSIGTQYEIKLGGYGSVTPRVDAVYTPASCGDVTCDADVQNNPYTLVNGRVTYWAPGKGWSLALQVTNLTDKLYYLSKTNTGAGYLDGQIGPPRMWAVTFRKLF
jgi:iron complex outermembrane recepter protein